MIVAFATPEAITYVIAPPVRVPGRVVTTTVAGVDDTPEVLTALKV